MPADIPTLIEQIDFRVVVYFDNAYQTFVATCLETGAVATGETVAAAEKMITEVLENDIRFAVEQGSVESLLRAPAPLDVVMRWYDVKAIDPTSVKSVSLAVAKGPMKLGARSEIRLISSQANRERSAS